MAFGILVFVLPLDVVVFRWGNQVSEKLDENRMLVTEKVFGFLIAAITVPLVLDGPPYPSSSSLDRVAVAARDNMKSAAAA